MPIVTKRIEKYFPDIDVENEITSILMSTIRVPRNLLYLTEKLPKSKYIGGEFSMLNSERNIISNAKQTQHLPIISKPKRRIYDSIASRYNQIKLK